LHVKPYVASILNIADLDFMSDFLKTLKQLKTHCPDIKDAVLMGADGIEIARLDKHQSLDLLSLSTELSQHMLEMRRISGNLNFGTPTKVDFFFKEYVVLWRSLNASYQWLSLIPTGTPSGQAHFWMQSLEPSLIQKLS